MIMNCGEAFHTDSSLAEANPGHSDRDAILQALFPGPSTVVLFGPGKVRMPLPCYLLQWHISANTKPKEKLIQHYKTHAHHFEKHKSIFRLHVQHFKQQVQHFPTCCTCHFQRLLCFLKWCACVSTDGMHSILKAPSDPSTNGIT